MTDPIMLSAAPLVPDEAGRPGRPAAGPLAGADHWRTVMERASWRCQCERPHPKHRAGRCENEHRTGCTLVAGPRNPGPDPSRSMQQCDPSELIAWCPRCWDLAVKSARKVLQNAARLHDDDTDTLF